MRDLGGIAKVSEPAPLSSMPLIVEEMRAEGEPISTDLLSANGATM